MYYNLYLIEGTGIWLEVNHSHTYTQTNSNSPTPLSAYKDFHTYETSSKQEMVIYKTNSVYEFECEADIVYRGQHYWFIPKNINISKYKQMMQVIFKLYSIQ